MTLSIEGEIGIEGETGITGGEYTGIVGLIEYNFFIETVGLPDVTTFCFPINTDGYDDTTGIGEIILFPRIDTGYKTGYDDFFKGITPRSPYCNLLYDARYEG